MYRQIFIPDDSKHHRKMFCMKCFAVKMNKRTCKSDKKNLYFADLQYIKILLVCVLFFPFIAFAQSPTQKIKKEYTFYFEKSDNSNNLIFKYLPNCQSESFFKTKFYVELLIFEVNNGLRLQLGIQYAGTDCGCKYRNFAICDSLFPEKLTFLAQIKSQSTVFEELNFQNKIISSSQILLDTTFASALQSADFQINIKKIELKFDTLGIQRLQNGYALIERYYQLDSLYQNWHSRLDSLDENNIDLLPLHRFEWLSIKKEVTDNEKNNFEMLLARSEGDITQYLQKHDILWQKIEDKDIVLSQKMAKIDDLMYQKGIQYQKEGNVLQAIYYFNRCLDFNPEHCQAIEKLTTLYIANKMYEENLRLFQVLRISGQISVCEAEVVDNVCDSLCLVAQNYIHAYNYYDALKILDTVEMFFSGTHHQQRYQKFLALKNEAQNGIYDSYFLIINKAIDNQKDKLAKEYILSLANIMREDAQNPCNQPAFVRIVQRLSKRYFERARTNLAKKYYQKALSENVEMFDFLDSLNCTFNQPAYFEIFTECYTAIYEQKLKDNDADLETFYDEHRQYIRLKKPAEIVAQKVEFVPQIPSVKEDSLLIYSQLYNTIYRLDLSPRNALLLDSFTRMRQYKPYLLDTLVFGENQAFYVKMVNLLTYSLSLANQALWGNEFAKADAILEKAKKMSNIYLLDTENVINEQFTYTENLYKERFWHYEDEAFVDLLQKINANLNAKQFANACQQIENEKNKFSNELYIAHLEDTLQKYLPVAIFEQKYETAKTMLTTDAGEKGFKTYDSVYQYFIEQKIDKFGLTCDSLFKYVMQIHQSVILNKSAFYFVGRQNVDAAVLLLQESVKSGFSTANFQKQLGHQFYSMGINSKELLTKYSFSGKYKIFLENYIGKFNTFWYLLWKREK
jgi:hypothetical protein